MKKVIKIVNCRWDMILIYVDRSLYKLKADWDMNIMRLFQSIGIIDYVMEIVAINPVDIHDTGFFTNIFEIEEGKQKIITDKEFCNYRKELPILNYIIMREHLIPEEDEVHNCASCKYSFDKGPGEDTWLYCGKHEVTAYDQTIYEIRAWDAKACDHYEAK